MARIKSNGLEFEVVEQGAPDAPAVVLIMGLGMQLTAWPPEFVDAVVAAGYRVISFDNRDCGLSSKFDGVQAMPVAVATLRHFFGLSVKSPYSLLDMAHDTIGILDALGIKKAHIVGASMGGMIAQLIAANFPDRTLSLTSIMSTSGARGLPGPTRRARSALLGKPAGDSLDALVDHYEHLFDVIGSPAFRAPTAAERARLTRSLQRSFNPAGTARQLIAVIASGDRSADLARVRAPTLVIHGADDPLVPVAGGRDTAAKISGARLTIIAGMGHDFAPALVPILVQALTGHLAMIKS